MAQETYVTFDCTHSDVDENNNLTFYIDGFPEDENAEGTVIATVTLTDSHDIYTDWHYNSYRLNPQVRKLLYNIMNISIPEMIKERNSQKRENKEAFIKALHNVLSMYSSEYCGINRFEYILDDFGNEWLYVIYDDTAQKRININADSCKAILEDLTEHLPSATWLLPEERI